MKMNFKGFLSGFTNQGPVKLMRHLYNLEAIVLAISCSKADPSLHIILKGECLDVLIPLKVIQL